MVSVVPVFDYTEKKIVTINAYKQEMRNELERIRKLTSFLSPWVEKIKIDKICLYEYVDILKGIGKQGEVKMNEINIHTIADLERYVRSYGLPKLPICGLVQIYEHGLVALPGKPTPSIKDHRKAKNPYFSRYGEIWIEKLKSSSSMSNFCCITDLIRVMMTEAEKLMKGSVHEDDFFIFHDALVLMAAKETIEWTKENNCFHCWLLPMNGLQDGTPYARRPVGNSLWFMPLHNCCYS